MCFNSQFRLFYGFVVEYLLGILVVIGKIRDMHFNIDNFFSVWGACDEMAAQNIRNWQICERCSAS